MNLQKSKIKSSAISKVCNNLYFKRLANWPSTKTRMVTTRSDRRAKRPFDFEEIDSCCSESDAILSTLDKNRVGNSEFDDSKRTNKRGRNDKQKCISSFESLGLDVIRIIFDMLNSSRDLINTGVCSKFLMTAISSRAVIRSAVFNQGNPGNLIDSIIRSVDSRCIFTPSAFRLLKLTNGVRCERLEKCFGYNFSTKKSRRVEKFNLSDLGMFICNECENLTTTRILKDTRWIISNKRVATTDHWQYKMLTAFENKTYCKEVGTGNPIGPLFSLCEVKQITNSIKDFDSRKKSLEKCVLAECDRVDSNASSAKFLVELHHEAVKDHLVWIERRRLEVKRKTRESNQTKLEGLQKNYIKLQELLDDNEMPLMKEVALECTWKRNLDVSVSVYFNCDLIRPILTHSKAGPFGYGSPEKTTYLMIQKAALKIRKHFEILYSKDFFSFSFLSSISTSFRRAMFQYCRDHISPSKILSSIPLVKGENFITQVKKNKIFTALILALYEQYDILEEIFIRAVCDKTSGESEKMKSLARNVWRDGTSCRTWQRKTAEEIRIEILEQRRNCGERFRQLGMAIIDFMEHPGTRDFINAGNDNNQEVTREDAVNTVYKMRATHRHLISGNFNNVLGIVENYLWDPRDIDLLD